MTYRVEACTANEESGLVPSQEGFEASLFVMMIVRECLGNSSLGQDEKRDTIRQ
jgi:hypothetical protein